MGSIDGYVFTTHILIFYVTKNNDDLNRRVLLRMYYKITGNKTSDHV